MKWFSRESVIDRVIVKFMISFPYISGTLVYLCMFGFWRVGLMFIIFPLWDFWNFLELSTFNETRFCDKNI